LNRLSVARLALAALFISTAASAQGAIDALDLTADEKPKTEDKKSDATKAPETKPVAPKPDLKPEDKNSGLERDVTQEDRVKSRQRKLYIKRGRFELAPYFFATINDPYYAKFGGAIRGAFYLADTLAISARGSLMQVLSTDDVRAAKRSFQSRIFFSVPIWSLMGDFEWSPIYGKVAMFNSILHFDAYVCAGAGIVTTDTSAERGRGPNPAADLGLGFRFVVKDFFAINVALINTTYVDTPKGALRGITQNLLALHAGFSLFIPFKSTYREAE
jgi:outer membrane beta-barrel protein